MKKLVAVLLSATMILSLAGCSKEEETTKKKKTKKTTTEETEDTDDPTEDPTDDPTDDTTEPVADTSSDTSDTTSGATPKPDGNSVISLHTEIDRDEAGYGRYNQDDHSIHSVEASIEYPTITAEGYEDLQDAIFNYWGEADTLLADYYTTTLDQYLNGDLIFSEYAFILTDIFRDDSYIFSAAIQYPNEFPGADRTFEAHSFWSGTAEEIKLQDVITDTDAVLTALKEYSMEMFSSEDPVTDPDFVASVKDGTCPFTLTYDGICFFLDYWYIKIPVSAIPDAVDSRYFGSTPDNYFLMLDAKGEIQWDFDGDGVPEDLSVGNADDSDFLDAIVIHHNGNDYTIDTDVWGEFHWYDDNYVMKTSDGFYMYLLLGVDEGMEYIGFKYSNGEWTGLGRFDEGSYFFGHQYDPQNALMSEYIGLTGTHYYQAYFDFDGNDGKPVRKYHIYYDRFSILETKQDIPCDELDDDLAVVGQTTLPSGSVVNLMYYDPDYEKILLRVCTTDPSQDTYVSCDVDTHSNPMKIGGIAVDDALYGIIYGG
ncbi:MAG: hypothetical protein IK020_04690 [Clostridiales bacterium]|nr:hypothetical protein [Clostridiales bacterium]